MPMNSTTKQAAKRRLTHAMVCSLRSSVFYDSKMLEMVTEAIERIVSRRTKMRPRVTNFDVVIRSREESG